MFEVFMISFVDSAVLVIIYRGWVFTTLSLDVILVYTGSISQIQDKAVVLNVRRVRFPQEAIQDASGVPLGQS